MEDSKASLAGVEIEFWLLNFSALGDGGFGLSPRISDTDLCRIVPDDIRVILPGGD